MGCAIKSHMLRLEDPIQITGKFNHINQYINTRSPCPRPESRKRGEEASPLTVEIKV